MNETSRILRIRLQKNIVEFSYDLDSHDFIVRFNDGRKYLFPNMPLEKWQEMIKARSETRYFNRNILKYFDYRELTGVS